jgi:S-adenosylmethionine/arginine decarboxylase-like enzyme
MGRTLEDWLRMETRVAAAKWRRHPAQNKRHWGFHLMLDIGGANAAAMRDGDKIRKFLAELVEKIKMQPIGPPVMHEFEPGNINGGWSAMQLISTSTITLHAANIDNTIYLDVFSCKSYDEDEVIDLVVKYFGPKRINRRFVYRDAPGEKLDKELMSE